MRFELQQHIGRVPIRHSRRRLDFIRRVPQRLPDVNSNLVQARIGAQQTHRLRSAGIMIPELVWHLGPPFGRPADRIQRLVWADHERSIAAKAEVGQAGTE